MPRRAFTLLERLLVVSIVCLLIGLLLPVLGHARDAARLVAGACNQRQVATAAHACVAGQYGRHPVSPDPRSLFPGRPWSRPGSAAPWSGPRAIHPGPGLLIRDGSFGATPALGCPGDDP